MVLIGENERNSTLIHIFQCIIKKLNYKIVFLEKICYKLRINFVEMIPQFLCFRIAVSYRMRILVFRKFVIVLEKKRLITR